MQCNRPGRLRHDVYEKNIKKKSRKRNPFSTSAREFSTSTRNRDKEKKLILKFSSFFFHTSQFKLHTLKILPTLGATALLYSQYCIINTSSPENINATLAGTFHPKTQRTFSAFWYSMATPSQWLPKLKTLPFWGNVLHRHNQPGEPCKINKSPEV